MDPIRNAEDASRYLDRLIDRERMPDASRARMRFDLGPIRALLDAVGNPQRGLSILHIAGSKGKGSVCLSAEPVLRSLGERVGVFTSPHLEHWTERFRIDGAEVSGEALARAVARLRPHVDRLRAQRPDAAPSFFDATTAAALLLFSEARVDRVLLEVGLGGRLDSTNAVQPRVTCVTQIELEHTQILGDTLAEIAAEKAGILKPGVPCVMGALATEAEAVLRDRARELSVELFAEGEHFELVVEPLARGSRLTRLRYADRWGLALAVELPIAGDHLARNAGLALACVRCLREHDERALERAAQQGLRALRLPGRVEIVGREPRVVIDSAHTVASARALAETLARLGIRDAELVLSVSRGKTLPEILAALAPCAASMTLTQADPDRSLAADELARAVRDVAPTLSLRVVADPREAIRTALGAVPRERAVVVAGSVYLAGIARQVIRDLSASVPNDRSAGAGSRA